MKKSLPVNEIIHSECIAAMEKMPDESIDLIFADPPYNLQIDRKLKRPDESRVEGVHEKWDSFESFAHYDEFTEKWLVQARRILKKNGAIWTMGSYHNIFRVGNIMQNLGFWILNDVIWLKTNPMPNFRGTRFTNAHETLIWAGRDKNARPCFQYHAMKALNEGVQMRSDWVLPLCVGGERLKNEKGEKLHPTQKPEALLYRVLLASSKPGDVVLDPFAGTATSCAVAKKLGRNFIGIEAYTEYVQHAKARLAGIKPLSEEALAVTLSPRAEPRIAFGALVERGIVKPGTQLFGPARKYGAKVRADGSLKAQDKTGSIHKMGALLQGREACNGWKFWHIASGERLVPIDDLRAVLRLEMVGK